LSPALPVQQQAEAISAPDKFNVLSNLFLNNNKMKQIQKRILTKISRRTSRIKLKVRFDRIVQNKRF
jgi:hypothetical protein